MVQELQNVSSDEQKEGNEVIQEWHEEELENIRLGVLRISKNGSDRRQGHDRTWKLKKVKRESRTRYGNSSAKSEGPAGASSRTAEEKDAEEFATQVVDELLSQAQGPLLRETDASVTLRPAEEVEVFEETRGNETRGRLQYRNADGHVVLQQVWVVHQDMESGTTVPNRREESRLHPDGRRSGIKEITEAELAHSANTPF